MTRQSHKHFLFTPIFAVLGRFGGFIIPILAAVLYGANPQTDVFFFVFGFVSFFASFFSRYFESLIPLWRSFRGEPAKEAASIQASLLLIYIITAISAGGLLAFLSPILKYSTGIDPQWTGLALRLYIELLPMIIFAAWFSMAESVFNSHKVFWFPAVAPLIRSLPIIIIMVLGHKTWGIHAITWGYAAGEALRFAVTLVLLRSLTPFRFHLDFEKIKPQMKLIFQIGFFQVMGVLAIDIQPLVDQWFASWLPEGNLSLLSYGDRLMLIPDQLFMIGFLQVFLTYWTDHYHEMSKLDFVKRIRRDMGIVIAAVVLIVIPAWMARGPIVSFCFMKSQLSPDQKNVLAELLGWLLLGFAPTVLSLLYIRVLFVIQAAKLYFVYAFSQLAIKVAITVFLMSRFGVNGIAMGTLLSTAVTVLGLHACIERRILRETGKS